MAEQALTDLDIQALLRTEPYVRLLRRAADDDPDAPALTLVRSDGPDETISRGELERQSNQWARAFQDLGVGFGDFVTIALPNSIEFVLATVGCWKIGAVPQPVSAALSRRERRAIVELAQSRLVLGADPEDHPQRRCLSADFAPAADYDDAPLAEVVSPSAKAPTSGGSTGRPKLIVSGGAAETSPFIITYATGLEPADKQLVCGPLYHNAPLINTIHGLVLGAHTVVLPRFDAAAALSAISRYGITWLQVVPTMMRRMLRLIDTAAPNTYELGSIRQLWHMAAPCPAPLKQSWIDLLGPDKVLELYGGTESTAITRITGTEWLRHRGSVGRPYVGEMKVLGENGRELPPGEVGEIYMRRPPGTPASYRYIGANPKAHDGWESLGDLGWMDADGYLYISDRRTDMVVSGGANIYPAEVEAALESHPDVECAVVVGLPDEDLGQLVHAIVQVCDGSAVDQIVLQEHLSELLVRYKQPRSFEFTHEALRDDAGKVRRSALRDRAIERLANV